MVMHAGGMRSLVATAMVVRELDAGRVLLVYMDDGRPDAGARGRAAELSGEALGVKRCVTLEVPHLCGPEAERDAAGRPVPMLWAAQALPAALALARRHQCDRLVWPASGGGDARAALGVAERAELVMALAGLEGAAMPRVQVPLAELSDAQVVGLGERLGVDWRLSRSCTSPGVGLGRPGCEACGGCERRAAAFAAAGVMDPLLVAGAGKRASAA